jgi:hypothetical protein
VRRSDGGVDLLDVDEAAAFFQRLDVELPRTLALQVGRRRCGHYDPARCERL